MKQILLATHNRAKLKELGRYFASLSRFGITLISLSQAHIKESPEESGNTFRKNALIKAEFYSQASNLPVVADDGGLCIDALDGAPGVRSRRWPGHQASDNELIRMTLMQLKNTPRFKRKATLQTWLCFKDPQSNSVFFSHGTICGRIAEKPSSRRVQGYPYRSLFIVGSLDRYYDELTEEEHLRINHRRAASYRLVKKIQDHVLELKNNK